MRELTSRQAIHDVPAPVLDHGPRIRLAPAERRPNGHFSRWEGGPTAFGPVGRVGITVVVGAWLLNGFLHTFFILWLPLAFVGGMVLRDVWKRTWIPSISVTVTGGGPDSDAPASGPRSLRPEARPVPATAEIPTRTKVAWVVVAVIALAACVGFAYGSTEVKAAVLMASTMSALALWYASFA